MFVSDEQPLNAAEPMLVTLFGTTTLVMFVQLRKADAPMATTGCPSIVSGTTRSPVAGATPFTVAFPEASSA